MMPNKHLKRPTFNNKLTFSRFKGIPVVECEVAWEGSERILNTLREVGRKSSTKKLRVSAASSFWMKAANMSRTSRASAVARA